MDSDFKHRPLVYLTRVEKFCSAHRLSNKNLDPKENARIFDKCHNIHGHNYTLKVTIKGPIDDQTGMVINMTDFKNIIEQSIIKILDHKYLDNDVEYFQTNISTSEQICVFIWQQINKQLPKNIKLHSIKLHETDKNIVEYYGEFVD